MAGYYFARGSEDVIDDLYAKAAVLDDGSTKVALVVCDLITLPRTTVLEARQLIEQQTGIPGGHVMISATHTHTGPAIPRDSVRDNLTAAAATPSCAIHAGVAQADRAGGGRGEWEAGRRRCLVRKGARGPAGLLPAVLDEGRHGRLEPGQAESEHHSAGQSDRSGGRRRLFRDDRQEAAADLCELRPARGHDRRVTHLGGLSRRPGAPAGGLHEART